MESYELQKLGVYNDNFLAFLAGHESEEKNLRTQCSVLDLHWERLEEYGKSAIIFRKKASVLQVCDKTIGS